MCEESACLVPPLDQAQLGTTESRRSTPAASHNGEALVGFHEDALSQAAVGKAQFLLAVVLGLALSADCSELTILEYILPAAELQLCIDGRKKGWLVSITLLALAGGSLAWGILGDYMGRRRALISALSLAGLFSAVATVMPTYGTFMTARFCSGLGIAGAFPLSFAYLSETCPRSTRSRHHGLAHALWPAGGVFTALVAHFVMPATGAELVEDSREHWSAWHRLLVVGIAPIALCLLGLVWASESPRYLLEAAREVEALAVYQRLHRLNKARTQYGLTELELPGRSAYRERPGSPGGGVFGHGMNSLRDALQRISSPTHFRTTLLLAVLHLIVGFTYTGISNLSAATLKHIKDEEYNSHKTFIYNKNYTGHLFNNSLENIQFTNVYFKEVAFRHIIMNHVDFLNCTIDDAEFVNVKASITAFKFSTIKDSRFVDTDLTQHHFINCSLINNTFLSLISDCVVDFDYNLYLDDLYEHTLSWAGSMFPALLLMGFILETVARPPLIAIAIGISSLSCIGIFFWTNTFAVTLVELTVRITLMCAINTITIVVVEGYPCHLRCTAHGMMRSLFHVASLCAIPIYGMFGHTMLMFPAVITIVLTFVGATLSLKIQDNSKVLL